MAGGSKSPDITSGNVQQPPVIEDWQIPPHYRRATLDDKEIDAINVSEKFNLIHLYCAFNLIHEKLPFTHTKFY